jgi:hypothetical protein
VSLKAKGGSTRAVYMWMPMGVIESKVNLGKAIGGMG